MPTLVVPQVTSWSASKLNDYRKCPLLFKLKHLLKQGNKGENSFTIKGSDVHEKAQRFVQGATKKLPSEIASFAEEFATIRKSKLKFECEKQVALSRTWELVDWFSSDAWFRGMVDIIAYDHEKKHVQIIDIKTGKIWPEAEEQIELYALCALILYPLAETVSAELWYTEIGQEKKSSFVRADEAKLKKLWTGKVAQMMKDRRFAPRAGQHCRWCEFGVSKGGPCKNG